MYRSRLKEMIQEPDKKITPKVWRKELSSLQTEYEATHRPYSVTVRNLAATDVLLHNRKDLERILENESHRKSIDRNRNRDTAL